MKKILFLLALVISAVFTTCEGSNNSKPGNGETLTITFNANGGTGGAPATASVKSGDPMPSLTAAPAKADHDFTGYFDATTAGKKYYNADLTSAVNTWDKEEDATLYAQWKTALVETGSNSSIVSIVQAPSTITQASQFTQESINALVAEAVRVAGGLDGIVKAGDTVVLKPNIINGRTTWVDFGGTNISQTVNGVCTDYRVVKAAAILVREIVGAKGTPGAGKILIIEGSGKGSTTEHFTNLGYTLANIPEVDEIIALDNEGTWADGTSSSANTKVMLNNFVYNTAPTSGTYSGKYLNDGGYYVNKKMYDADVLICLPVVKNHWNAVVTGAIKNISIGAAPPRVYGISGTDVGRNNMVNHDSIGFHQWIADYYSCLPADFVIMDGLQGLENGPLPGSIGNSGTTIAAAQKNMRTILASRDALAIDVVETNIINWDYTTVKYLEYLTTRGQVGVAPKAIRTVRGDPKNITVLGNIKVDDIRTDFAGILPASGGNKLTAAQLTQPTVNITSATFSGQNLNLKLNVSENVVKVDIYIDGTYVRSFNGNLADITLDTTGIAGGSKSITVQAFSRFMRQNTASVTASK
jgi:uncharacterized protein (DUF362 family)